MRKTAASHTTVIFFDFAQSESSPSWYSHITVSRHTPIGNILACWRRFLQHSCLLGEEKCPLAHVLDPCRLPQCVFFAAGKCHRDDCPFLHVTYAENTPMCPEFARGRCDQGREVCLPVPSFRFVFRLDQLCMNCCFPLNLVYKAPCMEIT